MEDNDNHPYLAEVVVEAPVSRLMRGSASLRKFFHTGFKAPEGVVFNQVQEMLRGAVQLKLSGDEATEVANANAHAAADLFCRWRYLRSQGIQATPFWPKALYHTWAVLMVDAQGSPELRTSSADAMFKFTDAVVSSALWSEYRVQPGRLSLGPSLPRFAATDGYLHGPVVLPMSISRRSMQRYCATARNGGRRKLCEQRTVYPAEEWMTAASTTLQESAVFDFLEPADEDRSVPSSKRRALPFDLTGIADTCTPLAEETLSRMDDDFNTYLSNMAKKESERTLNVLPARLSKAIASLGSRSVHASDVRAALRNVSSLMDVIELEQAEQASALDEQVAALLATVNGEQSGDDVRLKLLRRARTAEIASLHDLLIAFCHAEADVPSTAIVALAVGCSRLFQFGRAMSQAQKLGAALKKLLFGDRSKYRVSGSDLLSTKQALTAASRVITARRCYFTAHRDGFAFNPVFLVFEVLTGFLLRKRQVSVVNDVLEHGRVGFVTQMIMGQGKTTVRPWSDCALFAMLLTPLRRRLSVRYCYSCWRKSEAW